MLVREARRFRTKRNGNASGFYTLRVYIGSHDFSHILLKISAREAFFDDNRT